MKITIDIDELLLAKARYLTGIADKPTLVREGLRALIERESALQSPHRLANLGGSEPQLELSRRRQTDQNDPS